MRSTLQSEVGQPISEDAQTTFNGESIETIAEDLNSFWILVCAFLVFFMQAGFTLLESGAVRAKNTKNILLKNVIDACIAAVAWWSVGYAFAFGSGCRGNAFIGSSQFFSSGVSTDESNSYFSSWVFNYAFSATASTIVSGAVSERTQFRSYVLYTLALTAFVYPIVAHWVWSPSGWLSSGSLRCNIKPLFSSTNGLLDFAGSGVVHMVGGGAALIGAKVVGPRIGRFAGGHVVHFEHSNMTQVVLGTLILWFGWYGFNSGSTGCVVGPGCMVLAGRAAMNTTLSIAAGGLTCLAATILIGAPGDVMPLLNGILAGAVSITAPCALVEPYAAGVIGFVGAIIYMGSARLLLHLRIDDPLDASPVHFFCGAWGVFSSGLFARKDYVESAYGFVYGYGVFYGGPGKQLGIQVLGIVAIAAWTACLSGVVFISLKKFGWLRVHKESELQGLDLSESIGNGTIFRGILNRFNLRKGTDQDKDIDISIYNRN